MGKCVDNPALYAQYSLDDALQVDWFPTCCEGTRILGPGTAPTLNRSTWSEATAPSGARPARVFADVGGKYGKGLRPQGGAGESYPPRMKRDDQRSSLYVIVDNYRTNLDDYREVYLLGIQMHSTTIKTAPRT